MQGRDDTLCQRLLYRCLEVVGSMERLFRLSIEEQRELEQAAEIQRELLGRRAPSIAGVELAGHTLPCRPVGGDYYDFLTYPDGKVGIVLGDVSGKGMPAALLMMSLQARVRVLAEQPDSLAGLMTRLNRSTADTCPSHCFITLVFCILDPRTGDMVYSNAGHHPPLLIKANGDAERLNGAGLVLGALPEAMYQERRCRVGLGDLVALFSDGVTEATSPDNKEFGEDRLVATLSEWRTESAQSILEKVNGAVLEWTAGALADDITLVVLRRTV